MNPCIDTNWLGTLGVLALEVGEGHFRATRGRVELRIVFTEGSWGPTIRDMGADNCPIPRQLFSHPDNAAIAPAIDKSLSTPSTRS